MKFSLHILSALIILVLLNSCGDDSVIPDPNETMPKGFTNDSVRIVSVVPFEDTTIIYNSDGSSWSTAEYFVLKNYGSTPINFYSFKDTIDSTWIPASKEWRKYRKHTPTDEGWFFKTKKNNLPFPIRIGLKRYFGTLIPLAELSKSYIVEADKTLEEKTPMVTINGYNYYLTHMDFLEREGDTLFLYKYNKTDTVLVDMIWWSNAQMNQVFYHE